MLRVESARDRRAAANAGIEQAIEAGCPPPRRLDLIVGIVFEHDPEAMAVWERDRRLEYPPRRRRAAPAPSFEVAPPAAAPTGQPAPSDLSAPVPAPAVAAPVAAAPASASTTVPVPTPAATSAPAVESGQAGEADVPLKVAS